ncbi:MAG: tetratricopeptide repeat protein [Chloroflexi bacterium]|nr:tetratricopeptide repeat protein [Chloroflexota bacterium]
MVDTFSHPSNPFPKHATPFVGRNAEISELSSYVNNVDVHLITLTGYGGIGKTRLAIEVAARSAAVTPASRQKSFADGTYFIALAPLTSSDFLATTIADELGITTSGEISPRDQLLAALEHKKALLVLDNFEHIMDGRQLVGDILMQAPDVTMLVTSRERLSLPGEIVYDVQGMSIPSTADASHIQDYSALRLFEQIAQKVDWRFELTEAEIPHVVHICRLVEGFPLAIEMVAAWVRILSCREIAEELAQSFELLESTLTHLPTRHQSFRVVFDYSWRLLTPKQRLVYQKMSVFRGGFTRKAAEQVTGTTKLDLRSLIDKSLLQFDGSERYLIHELLRQVAEDNLTQNRELSEETRDSHAAYYADFLEHLQTEFTEYDQELPVIARVHSDLDNVRVMWDWAVARQQFGIIDRAAESLSHYFRIRESWSDAVLVFQKAISVVEAAGPSLERDRRLATLLSLLSIHTNFCGLHDLTEKAAQQGLLLAREHNMPLAIARCLATLGDVAIESGMYADARLLLEETTSIYDNLSDTYEAKFVCLRLGFSYYHLKEYDLARRCFHRLIYTGHKRNMDGPAAWALDHLGQLENTLGNYGDGRQYYADSLEIFERFGWLAGATTASSGLASAYGSLGQYNKARYYFRVALKAYVKHGSPMNALISQTLLNIAKMLASEGEAARAFELVSVVQLRPFAWDETRQAAIKLSDELQSEIPPVVVQSAQERAAQLELEPLIASLIEEFDEEKRPAVESGGETNLELLQRVTEGLVAGELFDENITEKQQAGVRKLLDTLDVVLEKEKSRILSSFIQSASHDLNTPLTIINTSLYLLERISDPNAQKDRLALVKEQVAYLQSLIADLINMARLDGISEPELQPLDLDELLTAIQYSSIARLTAERQLAIDFSLSDTPLVVQANADLLQQAVFNIIQNAIQYTPDNGAVWIETRMESGSAIISVKDTGIGITEEDLPHIFERFYRADKARTERGHSGLGLAMAKKIIDVHGGQIDVVSASDQGSTFRIVLPQRDGKSQE